MAAETPTSPPPRPSAQARSAMLGAWLAFFVDLFDIYLPIVVLAPAMPYFIPSDLDDGQVAIATGAIFAATLIARPLGALIFGRIADTLGRKRTTIVAVTGAGLATLLIVFLPGYQQWGGTAIVALIALRFCAGVFLGGEYTAANPLAMESAPKAKRGLYSGIINTGFPLAYAVVSLITMILLTVLPSHGVDSAYAQWGWRIPFLVGAALSLGLVIYYRRTVGESKVFDQAPRESTPIRSLFTGRNLRSLLQVFVLMNGFWLSLQPIAAMLPPLLAERVPQLAGTGITGTLVIAYFVLAPVNIGSAVLSQRIGRRRFLVGAGVLMAVASPVLYYVLVTATPTGFVPLALFVTVVTVVVIGPWGVLPAYINERFRTGVRASGYGISYSSAVVLPSFYAFYQVGLAKLMPLELTGIVILVVGALLIVIGAACGPETKDVDFAADHTAPGPTAEPATPAAKEPR